MGTRSKKEDFIAHERWHAVGTLFDLYDGGLGNDVLDIVSVASIAENGLGQAAVYEIPNGVVAVEFRFYTIGGSDGETSSVQVYAGADEDYYRWLVQLDLTVGSGQRGSATDLFIDTIVENAGAKWISKATAVSPAATFASWAMNTHGYKWVLFMATAATLDMDPAVPGEADDSLCIEVKAC